MPCIAMSILPSILPPDFGKRSTALLETIRLQRDPRCSSEVARLEEGAESPPTHVIELPERTKFRRGGVGLIKEPPDVVDICYIEDLARYSVDALRKLAREADPALPKNAGREQCVRVIAVAFRSRHNKELPSKSLEFDAAGTPPPP